MAERKRNRIFDNTIFSFQIDIRTELILYISYSFFRYSLNFEMNTIFTKQGIGSTFGCIIYMLSRNRPGNAVYFNVVMDDVIHVRLIVFFLIWLKHS